MSDNANEQVTSPHRPECWCNGTGWRVELDAPCNLPQLRGDTLDQADEFEHLRHLGPRRSRMQLARMQELERLLDARETSFRGGEVT